MKVTYCPGLDALKISAASAGFLSPDKPTSPPKSIPRKRKVESIEKPKALVVA